jgi:predicted 3-demethylubiquinone-9 3-methyltransferase (glyoxalase superfamily)
MANINKKRITPFLWFDNNLEEAVKFYVSIFKNSRIISINPMAATFELDGQQFYALNGGPMFKFTEAISLFVDCDTQEEVDYYWEKLTADGQESRCGWLKDKFGLSWQVIPEALGRLMNDKDPAKAQKVVQAMMKMDKIIVSKLQEAYDQK